jgi:transcriptional regulator with PAS, ATPase and Fis domain
MMNVNNLLIPGDDLPAGYFSLDGNLLVTGWNRFMEEKTGLDRTLVSGKPNPVRFFASPFETDELDFRECLKGREGARVSNHVHLKTADGELKPFFVQISPLAETGGWIFLVSEISRSVLCLMLEEDLPGTASFQTLVGREKVMKELFERIRKAAAVDVTVLVTGESGTGKELIARAVHDAGNRREGPFVPVHCAALPEALLESELFGHVKGAFTGAVRDNSGRFEAARGGTLFLDEIGEISLTVQVKLLRVLQERRYNRVGESAERDADIRIVAATNRDLKALVAEGKFREDLYYRLNVFPLVAPPLRERRNDIPLLADHIVGKLNEKQGRRIRGLLPGTLRLLMEYPFPGNVRELENVLEHAFVLAEGDDLTPEDLPPGLRNRPEPLQAIYGFPSPEQGFFVTEKEPVAGYRYRNFLKDETVDRVLAEVNGNRSEAARRLGISRVSLWKKLKKRGFS